MAPFCPFDLERRPCGEYACALYVQTQYQDDQGQSKSEWTCVFIASAKLQFHGVVEQARTAASLDKAATVAVQGFGGVLGLAAQAARARALTNGEDGG